MGAVIIGIGVAIAAIGFVLGAVGFGSSETTSGAALFTAGSIVFVGGLVLFALGSLHRAVVDVANKLDGVLHFEPEEEHAGHAAPVQSAAAFGETSVHDGARESVNPPSFGGRIAAEPEDDLPPPRAPAARHDAPVRHEPPARSMPPLVMPEPEAEVAPVILHEPELAPVAEKAPGRGLPSWFRRKPAPEPEAESEPEAERVVAESFEQETLRVEPFQPESFKPGAFPKVDEPVMPPLSSDALRRDVPSFLREGLSRSPAPERSVPPAFGDEAFERPPRTPLPPIPERPRSFGQPYASVPPAAPEPAPDDTPAFLNVSDLLDDPVEEPEAPAVTLLKAGVIGGMAYKLYSDGSIEADLPDGTLRFASLLELREHVAASSAKGEG